MTSMLAAIEAMRRVREQGGSVRRAIAVSEVTMDVGRADFPFQDEVLTELYALREAYAAQAGGGVW